MAAPTSMVEIANLALDHLRQPSVSSIDPPDSETASIVARHYDSSRQDVLSKHIWKFAQKRASISRSGAGAFDYTDVYTLPTDFITFMSIEGYEWWQKDDYDRQRDSLYANAAAAASLNLRYICDETEVAKWTPNFRELVVLTLAQNIAFAITGSNNDVERLALLVKAKWEEVRSRDNLDIPPKAIRRSGSAEVVNTALDYLRLPPIKSIDTPVTQLENMLATHYNNTRRQQITLHIWKFAKTRASVARTGTPAFDYTDAYELPEGCLRVLAVGGERIIDQEFDYDISGRDLQLNWSAATTVDLRYLQDVTDTTIWDETFKEIVALELAKKVGPSLGVTPDIIREIDDRIVKFKPSALAVDAQAVKPKQITRSRIITKRLRGVASPDPRFYDVR